MACEDPRPSKHTSHVGASWPRIVHKPHCRPTQPSQKKHSDTSNAFCSKGDSPWIHKTQGAPAGSHLGFEPGNRGVHRRAGLVRRALHPAGAAGGGPVIQSQSVGGDGAHLRARRTQMQKSEMKRSNREPSEQQRLWWVSSVRIQPFHSKSLFQNLVSTSGRAHALVIHRQGRNPWIAGPQRTCNWIVSRKIYGTGQLDQQRWVHLPGRKLTHPPEETVARPKETQPPRRRFPD